MPLQVRTRIAIAKLLTCTKYMKKKEKVGESLDLAGRIFARPKAPYTGKICSVKPTVHPLGNS